MFNILKSEFKAYDNHYTFYSNLFVIYCIPKTNTAIWSQCHSFVTSQRGFLSKGVKEGGIKILIR